MPEPDDFTAAYKEFTGAKDAALGGDPADPPIEEPAEEIEGVPPEDPGPALELEDEPEEPELTPEQEQEQERLALLEEQQTLLRRQQDYERRTGKPLVSPEVIEKRVKRAEAEANVREGTPELAEAVESIVETRLAQEREVLLDEVQASNDQQAFELHQQSIAAAHPDYFDILENPVALMEWIDSLPGWLSDRYKAAFEDGTANEVIGMLNDWKTYPDPQEATAAVTAAFEQAAGGTPPAEETTQEAQPPAKPRAGTDDLEAARAVRGRGTTSPAVPTGASAPDEFSSAYRMFSEAERNAGRRAG